MKNDRIILRGVQLTYMYLCHNLWHGHGLFQFYDVNCFIIVICKLLKLLLLCIHHVGIQVV